MGTTSTKVVDGQECKYCAVSKGDCIRVIGGTNVSAYAAWGFFEEKPTTESTPYLFIPYSDISNEYLTAPKDGYILGSADSSVGVFIYKKISSLQEKIYAVEKVKGIYGYNVQEVISTYNDYYINKDGIFINQVGQITKCWEIKKGELLKVETKINSNYAAWALYEKMPDTLSKPILYAPYNNNTDLYLISPIDGYIASSIYIGNLKLLKAELSDIDAGWIKDRDLLLSCDYEWSRM